MNDRRLFRQLALCCWDLDEEGFRILADLAMERGLDWKLEALMHLVHQRPRPGWMTSQWPRWRRQYRWIQEVTLALRWIREGHEGSPWLPL